MAILIVMGVQGVADRWDIKAYIHPNDRNFALLPTSLAAISDFIWNP